MVVWVGQGRGRATIDQFFESPAQRLPEVTDPPRVLRHERSVHGRHLESLPECPIVLDRFHIVKALNDAIDDVRKEQWREASARTGKALKGLRWLLYRHSSTRSRRDTQTLRALEKHNRRIYRAWRLKDEFEQLWTFNAPWRALRFFKRWTTSALRSRLEPLRRFVATAPRHQAGILAFVETRVTNAVAEGLNRIVKIVKIEPVAFAISNHSLT